MALLRELKFVDLYIGRDFADVKAGAGAHAPRVPVPNEYHEEVEALRIAVQEKLNAAGDDECAHTHDGVIYRVTRMHDLQDHPVLFLRKVEQAVWPLEKIALPKHVLEHVLAASTKGLILISGDMGSGKTTTATALLIERLSLHGSFGLALEQPPEYDLNGVHGNGRCIQVPVTRRNGGFREQLQLAKRTSTSELLIGEIRCGETGAVAVNQTNVGTTVISTIHAKSPVDAITQLATFAALGGMRNPQQLISQGLAAVIHQRVTRMGADNKKMLMTFECLVVGGNDEGSIRQKIADHERVGSLTQDIHNQKHAQIHGSRNH